MLAWLSVWSEVQTRIWSSRCHCHSLSLASLKSRLFLPLWYWLTRVVPDKGPLNGCVYLIGSPHMRNTFRVIVWFMLPMLMRCTHTILLHRVWQCELGISGSRKGMCKISKCPWYTWSHGKVHDVDIIGLLVLLLLLHSVNGCFFKNLFMSPAADQYMFAMTRWMWVFTYAHSGWWELQPWIWVVAYDWS